MLERHVFPILIQPRKHFHENLLRQVFLGVTPRQVRPHNPDDRWIKVLDQLATRRFIALTHTAEARCFVKGIA